MSFHHNMKEVITLKTLTSRDEEGDEQWYLSYEAFCEIGLLTGIL